MSRQSDLALLAPPADSERQQLSDEYRKLDTAMREYVKHVRGILRGFKRSKQKIVTQLLALDEVRRVAPPADIQPEHRVLQ